jgi:dienelactone hydrolase
MLRTTFALATCLLVAACAGTPPPSGLSMTTTAYGVAEQIPVTVAKPDGSGPFPAVVIMHDCSGLGPMSSGAPGRWAAELVARGYVVVVPDSFTTRGQPGGICTVPLAQRRANVSPERRAGDAYAALAYARSLPYVDARRVGIMGGSHGGSTTLATMLVEPPDGAGFAAAVALYPRCDVYSRFYRPVAPLLILIGEKDDWTPAESCRKLSDAARAAGDPVTIKIYPGAQHSFDSPHRLRYVAARVNPNAPGGRGATTGGDPAAWADSIQRVAAFFEQHLHR